MIDQKMIKNSKKSIKELNDILNQHKSLLKSIDNKSSILLAICSINFGIVISLFEKIKWYFIFSILFLLVLVLIMLIISIYPRTKNLKKYECKDIIYFDSVNEYFNSIKDRFCKNKIFNKDDYYFFQKNISKDSLIAQIIRICQIISIKYFFQKIAIYILSLSIFLFVFFVLLNFLIF